MDEDFNYDDYDYGADEQMQDDDAIELENMFYEAEDKLRDDQMGALRLFDQIIAKEEEKFAQEEQRKQSFQSLKNSILIRSKILGQLPIIEKHLQILLKLFQYQYRNDGNEALNQILEALLRVEEEGVSQVFRGFIESLRLLQLSQLFIYANMKLCRVYTDRKNPKNLSEAIDNIQDSVNQVTDPDRKNNLLIELYAYQISLCNMMQQPQKIKDIYKRLIKLNLNVHDPRINATINETIGKMKLTERRWDQARQSLMQSFYSYQDVGDVQAKQVLRYAVLASILENFQLNLFDDLRTRVYEADDGIEAMKQIRLAYDQKDIKKFNQIKKQLIDDQFLNTFLGELHKVISFSKIIQLMDCYKKIKIDYLAQILEVDQSTTLRYMQELILTNQIKAVIDQVKGFIEVIQPQSEQLTILSDLINQI